MLGKSRTQTATDSGNRRYDLPGASLRGPYKLWIPKTDNRHSESENEGPRAAPSNSHRPHGHHGSTAHVAAGNTATTSTSTARHANTASTQHAAPAPQKQRSADRHPVGYSSESTVHPPANTSKSSFSLFKPHVKESRGHSSSTTKREELPRSTTAPAAVPSKHTASQTASAPQKYTSRYAPLQSTAYVSNSTPSSTDPSPRSSTDSGPRNGNVSAPVATSNYSDPHKQGQSTWNPYVDARIDRTSTSRRNESSSALPRREEKKSKDREDMVARVTEALGGGSTGKAKAAENMLLNNQAQTVRREDISTRRTTSTGTRGVEAQPYGQPQATQSSHRHRATPQATPFPGDARLPEHSSKSSRTHPEAASRAPEPPAKVSSSHSKVPATSSSRLPHPRTASSPWPFNQALPPEQVMPPSKPQNHSSTWKSFARFQGSSTPHTPDPRPPPKESNQYPSSRVHADELGRTAPPAHASAPHQQSSKSSLTRGIQPSATTSTSAPPRTVPPPAPAAPPPLLPSQTRTNASYASTSMEQPQRWSPSTLAAGRPTHQPPDTPQTPISKPPEKTPDPSPAPTPPVSKRESTTASGSVPTAPQRSANVSNVGMQESRSPWPTSSKYPETRTDVQVFDSATATHGRYLTPNSGGGSNVGMQSSSEARSLWPTTSRHPEPRHEPPTPPEPAPVTQGRYITTTTGTGSNFGMQPHNDSKSPWTSTSKHSEQRNEASAPPEPTPVAPGRYLTPHAATGSNVGMPSHSDSKSLWPTTPKNPEPHHEAPTPSEPASFGNGRHASTNAPLAPTAPPQAVGRSASASTANLLWTTSSKHPETANPIPVTSEAMPISNVRNDKGATTPAPGTWTSKYTQETYPASDSETDFIPKEPTPHSAGTTGNQTNPHQHTGASDRLVPGAWTSRYATANVSASTFEAIPPQRPSPKEGLGPSSTTYKYASATPAVLEPTNRGLRYASTNTVPTNNQPLTNAPGAWTTSSRYATNASVSIFDSSPSAKNGNPVSRESPPRQAILGATPVAGAWTTKPAPGSSTPSSEGTIRQTPVSQTPVTNAPASSSLLKPPPPASGTNTGTSTPSSTQISDLINQLSPVTSHSIATRVPISGHPSTPAPVRPVLRATPPPLSISSTSPDTDSLLTPSSLNSPRSTIALPHSQPVSTTTAADVQQPPEKDNAPRKNGFFDFFRPKPSLKTYEVWTPPPRTKDKERQKEPPPPPKQKQSAPVPVPPRPKSPRVFSPFKLFSKRHRTLSSASIDVLDGTAANTLMNSPASSMRADTPGGPPSPPLRDAFLATQEWRNKEATELVVSGRKRRHRPGVVFDCPEDSAPVDILPSRLRIGRVQNDDDDNY